MTILGIEQIIYGVDDLDICQRFMSDWGLELKSHGASHADFETLNGARVLLRLASDTSLPPAFETGPTLREVTWGVSSQAELDALATMLREQPGYSKTPDRIGCIDPNGMAIFFEVSRKHEIASIAGSPSNPWGLAPARINSASPVYDHAQPVEVGHVVFFTDALEATASFYQDVLGFSMSDRYPGRGAFLRCTPHGGHHDLFLLALPNGKRGLNHVAFAVRDIHEVFGGGMHIDRRGWSTQLGPGRHPVSSAYFWYFNNPCGGLIEYYADEDYLTPAWQPRDVEPSPTMFAEWAIDGGLNGTTRRQGRAATPPAGKFLTDRAPASSAEIKPDAGAPTRAKA
jgi:catechol 2,3-dioxygenase-like lactoylglutathione lyase family enzyme